MFNDFLEIEKRYAGRGAIKKDIVTHRFVGLWRCTLVKYYVCIGILK